jgi:uncharacterized damage-inducible protein DinB
MQLRTYARGMAAYNRWMNERLYAVAATLSEEERQRDLGAFFHSLHGTLSHILLGDQSWMQRFRGEPVTMTGPGELTHPDFAALRAARAGMDDEIARWAEGLSDDFGAAPFPFHSVTYGRDRVIPGWAAVVHLFNHQTHHRGQVTTLLRQLGRDPGVTDFPWMPFLDG